MLPITPQLLRRQVAEEATLQMTLARGRPWPFRTQRNMMEPGARRLGGTVAQKLPSSFTAPALLLGGAALAPATWHRSAMHCTSLT
jgi:hypothetical protein